MKKLIIPQHRVRLSTNYTYMDALFQFCWIFSYFQNVYVILVVWISICVIFILFFAFDGQI
jgi:hypothetical protein